ncbi:DinB family protein [Peribacillus butanolivorans]
MNHSTYHRGQIITIGRNVGLTDAPMTDFNIYNFLESPPHECFLT